MAILKIVTVEHEIVGTENQNYQVALLCGNQTPLSVAFQFESTMEMERMLGRGKPNRREEPQVDPDAKQSA